MHAPQLQYSNLMTGGLGLWMNDFLFLLLTTLQFSLVFTQKVLLAEMCRVGDFKGMGHFEAKF